MPLPGVRAQVAADAYIKSREEYGALYKRSIEARAARPLLSCPVTLLASCAPCEASHNSSRARCAPRAAHVLTALRAGVSSST